MTELLLTLIATHASTLIYMVWRDRAAIARQGLSAAAAERYTENMRAAAKGIEYTSRTLADHLEDHP